MFVITYILVVYHTITALFRAISNRRFMGSDIDDECEAAAKCLRTLTEPSAEGEMNENWKAAFDNGVIPAIVKVSVFYCGVEDFKYCIQLLRMRDLNKFSKPFIVLTLSNKTL